MPYAYLFSTMPLHDAALLLITPLPPLLYAADVAAAADYAFMLMYYATLRHASLVFATPFAP